MSKHSSIFPVSVPTREQPTSTDKMVFPQTKPGETGREKASRHCEKMEAKKDEFCLTETWLECTGTRRVRLKDRCEEVKNSIHVAIGQTGHSKAGWPLTRLVISHQWLCCYQQSKVQCPSLLSPQQPGNLGGPSGHPNLSISARIEPSHEPAVGFFAFFALKWVDFLHRKWIFRSVGSSEWRTYYKTP